MTLTASNTIRQNPTESLATIALLSDLIAIDSSDPPGNEAAVASRVIAELAAHGIAYEADEFAPGRVNILARVPGRGDAPPLVFSAHLDTVPVGTAPWREAPFGARIDGDRLYGRGSSDMKSGVAAMVAAAIKLAGEAPLAGDVLLALSAGESSNCLGAKRFVTQGVLADAGAVLVSEPSSLDVLVAEMAALWVRVITNGRIGHVSGDGGRNAIVDMAVFLARLDDIELPAPPHDLLPAPTITVGTIGGGTVVNVTPDRCEAMLDIRLRAGTTIEEAMASLEGYLPADAAIEVIDFKPSVETAPDHPFVRACIEECARAIGSPPAVAGVSYYSDATIFQSAHGTPFAIVGPGELGMSGQSDEWVSIARVEQSTQIFANIARRWLA